MSEKQPDCEMTNGREHRQSTPLLFPAGRHLGAGDHQAGQTLGARRLVLRAGLRGPRGAEPRRRRPDAAAEELRTLRGHCRSHDRLSRGSVGSDAACQAHRAAGRSPRPMSCAISAIARGTIPMRSRSISASQHCFRPAMPRASSRPCSAPPIRRIRPRFTAVSSACLSKSSR